MPKHPSLSDVSIHQSLTNFILLQDGVKSVKDLYPDLIKLVFDDFSVIWVDSDVGSVIRTANKRGSALLGEVKSDEEKKVKYEKAMEYIAENSQTRTSASKAKAQFATEIKDYESMQPHHHNSLSLAQLALHNAMLGMAAKAKAVREEKVAEEKRMKELVRAKRKADEQEEREKRLKTKQEKSQKKIEEAAKAAKKEVLTTRAINGQLITDLRERNINTYRQKRVDNENGGQLK
jgi:uncharacterized protein (DUF305 family)